MSRICNICEKKPRVKNLVSHAKNRVKSLMFPNVHKMRFVRLSQSFSKKFKVECGSVCTRCVRSGEVKKVI